MNGIYLVVRDDLEPGLQAAQIGHVAMRGALAVGCEPEFVYALSAKDEAELLLLAARCGAEPFREPDLSNEATAFAAPETPEVRRALSSQPLALKRHRACSRRAA